MPANKFRRKPTVVEAVKWVGMFDIKPMKPMHGLELLCMGLGEAHNAPLDVIPSWLVNALAQKVLEVGLLEHPMHSASRYEISARLRSAQGWYDVAAGDWLVKDGQTIYSVKADLFAATYEEAVDNAPVDEAVYFTMRQNAEGVIRPWPSSSLEMAKSEARHAIEHGQSAFVSVCQEIVTYSRSYSVVEQVPKNPAKGKIGEA